MLLNPEAQRRAHEELDRVIGRDRVPTFDDLPKLSYLRATVGSSSKNQEYQAD